MRVVRRAPPVLLLYLAAAAYFAIGSTLTLEWADEGQILYPSWRVASGAIPYRDFCQLYGPSVFLLNGRLLRTFGDDLLVVRASLVVLKAIVAVVIYLGARRLAAWPFALGVYGFFVAVWGAPMWVFNAPYANHYSMTIILVGLLGFLALRRRFALACLVAGLCFGLAATFKQTSGVFACAAFVLYLLWLTPPATPAPGGAGWRVLDWSARAARAGALLGVLALCVAYLWPANTAWNVLVLFSPLALVIGVLAVRELRGALDPAARVRSLAGLALCLAGAVVPVGGYALYYADLGLLPALVFNTVSGLPRVMKWFVPVPYPDLWTGTGAAAVLAALATVRLWRTSAAYGGAARRAAARLSLAALVVLLIVLGAKVASSGGLLGYFRGGAWQGAVLRMYFFVPFLTVWTSLHALGRSGAPAAESPGRGPKQDCDALALFAAYATTSLLYLYPAGDFWHVIMALPAFLPLLAHELERFQHLDGSSSSPRFGALVSAAVLTALIVVLSAPPVLSLATTRLGRSAKMPGFARASGISGTMPKFGEAAALVGHLRSQLPAEGKLLVVANEQMLYFLAGRPSILEKEEYLLYLVGAGLVADADARTLVPATRIIERLEGERPLVVDYAGSPGGRNFREVYPEVAAYLDQHYRVVQTFGKYRLLEWSANVEHNEG